MRYFDSLIGAEEGRPAIVICGGPSAPEQLKKAQNTLDNPVLISVNEHGCKLTKCDYSVSLDNIRKKMIDCDTHKLSPWTWADTRLTGYWNAHNSGCSAVWVAWKLGCSPVVIVGADLYKGGTYWWDANAHSSGRNTKLEGHLNEWRVLPSRVPCEIVAAVDGPLVQANVLQKYDGRKKYPAVEYKSKERVKKPNPKASNEQKIRVLRGTWIEGQQYWPGEEAVVRERSARMVVNMGKAEYVNRI